jgi:hypothetical protein
MQSDVGDTGTGSADTTNALTFDLVAPPLAVCTKDAQNTSLCTSISPLYPWILHLWIQPATH